MAGDLTAIIGAIKTRMTALGFAQADAVFDFDTVPDSIIDKAYRLETRLLTNDYGLGNRADTVESIEIFIAYALERAATAAWEEALDDRERIEKDIISNATIAALAQAPILTLNQEAAALKYLEQYLVSKVVFRCDYIRSLA